MLESLRHTKGSGAVVKELNQEVSQLHSLQKAVMADIGRRTLAIRPEMPGTAGLYAALDRLASSLEAKQRELKIIEDDIGPVWNTVRMGFGTMKRPFLFVGAVAGGLLLLYLLWTLLAVVLLGTGYRAEYRPLIEGDQPFLEVKVTGKAAKLAVMLTDPKGKTETQIIEENEMITNAKAVKLAMERKPAPGTYTLLVKTFQPEQVVYKASPKFARGKLTILDASFTWRPCRDGNQLEPTGITITVNNGGTLPVCFDRLRVVMGGQTCERGCVVERASGDKETVGARPWFQRDRSVVETELRQSRGLADLVDIGGAFRPGTYPATMKLYVAGEQEEFLTFEKQVTIPPPK
jgi:hypothetical protein